VEYQLYGRQATAEGTRLTLIADEQQHGHTDVVQYAQPWIFGKDAIPYPQGEVEWQFARQDEPDPSST
jgi:hypothetical protein